MRIITTWVILEQLLGWFIFRMKLPLELLQFCAENALIDGMHRVFYCLLLLLLEIYIVMLLRAFTHSQLDYWSHVHWSGYIVSNEIIREKTLSFINYNLRCVFSFLLLYNTFSWLKRAFCTNSCYLDTVGRR